MCFTEKFEAIINKKVGDLKKTNRDFILVFKGFESRFLPNSNKYFEMDLPNLDTIIIEEYEEIIYKKIRNNLINRNQEHFSWMTMEEYILYSDYQKIEGKKIIVLENNIYGKYYPYNDTLSDIKEIYQTLYYQDSKELSKEEQESLKLISKFYGKIEYSKKADNYYITYNEIDSEYTTIELFKLENFTPRTLLKGHENNFEYQIEISEDEIPFLDLTQILLSSKKEKNILFIINKNENQIFQNIFSRIDLLDKITRANFHFMALSIKKNSLERIDEYREILFTNYGYSNFKEIDFYTNIASRTKETIKISQAQIIDDIISQAELALDNKYFRDVYITASTGAGKSIMFQIPALYLSKKYVENPPLTLIISPLIGLMNDQVQSMKSKGISTAATINGNTLPYERESIISKVQNSEINLLYLSPETLQARSDIKQIIGERRIGLVIIDEAHIVTTWGKSFRADYWYLGIYLKKLRKTAQFPIVTFTATAIYGGPEDMYLDTRESLNMLSPISYFGKVRRDDLLLNVTSALDIFNKGDKDYKKTKNFLALLHLKEAYQKNEKSLIYFPTVKLLNYFYRFLNSEDPQIAKVTSVYYGSLDKEKKDETLKQFKNGALRFVLATKAFGMGIDIDDINNVYHFAPTGNVVDYIQEIGRAARSKSMTGYGIVNFLKPDFNEVNRLHGMSSIKKDQIIEVMKKIVQIYREKNFNRNLLVSSEDFKYIFNDNETDDYSSIDNKVKTILLMIEKDFASPHKIGFEPFAARPKTIFANELLLVNNEIENILVNSPLKKYFKKKYVLEGNNYTAVYDVELSNIWERYFKEMTYPEFKYSLFTKEKREKLKYNSIFENFIFGKGLEIQLNNNYVVEEIFREYKKVFTALKQFYNNQLMKETFFSANQLAKYLKTALKISDDFKVKSFSQVLINSLFSFMKIKQVSILKTRENFKENTQTYKFTGQDIEVYISQMLSSLNDALKPKSNYVKNYDNSTIIFKGGYHTESLDLIIASLGIGNSLGLFSFQVHGGNTPKIYIRMNSVNPLERAINQGTYYQNDILNNVYQNHKRSVAMLKYLFLHQVEYKTEEERIQKYTEWFWETIENYFMGIVPELELHNKD